MGENKGPHRNLWCYGAIYLGIIGLWWLCSAGWFGFENWESHYRFAGIMINKTGLAAMIFAGRYLLFPGRRSPRIFGWTLGGGFLALIGAEIWMNPDFSVGMVCLARLGDGLIWCLNAAWLLELTGAIYLDWSRVPLEAAGLAGIKRRFGADLFKLGLFNATVGCFLELHWVSVFAVEMIPVGYYLLIPFLGTGMGLYGIFAFRLNRMIEERIGPVDLQLLGLLDWKMGESRESLIGLTPGEIERTKVLLLWRRYLGDLKKPGLAWWVLGAYFVLSGLIIGLPYWMKVVIEV